MTPWVEVVVAEETTNLCTNPSFEAGTSDWTLVSTVVWSPASPTDDGGETAAHWFRADLDTYQDDALSTPATADGDPVGGWGNQNTDGDDVTQGTSGNKPTLKLNIQNGAPVLRLDGSNDFLVGAYTSALTQPTTIFAVAALDAAAVNDDVTRQIIDGDDITDRMVFYQRSVSDPDKWTAFAGFSEIIGSNTDSDWNIWLGLFNGASSEFWLNGTSEATGNAGSETPDGPTVGRYPGTGSHWDGDIAEIIIYDNADLSTADKNQVGNYLADRYGLTWNDIS